MEKSQNQQADRSFVEDSAEASEHIDVSQLDQKIRQLAQESPAFYRNPNLLRLYLLLVCGCLGAAVTLGYDTALINSLQATPAWDRYFGRPRGVLLGCISAILALGSCLATPFISYVGDRWGRKWGVTVGCGTMLVGGIIQAASVNLPMFMISRFIVGFGLVFANTYAPILIGELAHPKDRQVITSLYQTSWYIGAILAAWIGFGMYSIPNDWAWRVPCLLQALPALIAIIGVQLLPESPRFLISKSRSDEALAIIRKYHGNDLPNSDLFVTLSHREMEAVIRAETENETPWSALWSTPGNRRRIFIIVMLGLFSQWSGNGLVSYYLARVLETVGITSAREQNIMNGSLQIFNWMTAVASAFLTAYLRRRTQFLLSVGGMLAVFATQTLCAGLFNTRGDRSAGTAVIPMLFLFYLSYNLAFNALLYSYPVEVLPYPIRAKGFSVLMLFGKAAIFVNALVNPIGLAAIGWRYYLVYVGWLVLECLGVWAFFVETKGPSLEAIAERFDGKKNIDHETGVKKEKDEL
ncbi:general substrate transporter [Elsinoe ampelina]|uniref:General substrate transporter n=1 Tax=Elsinoe ampelina TaxID=302913 RepID=A0A6A6GB13_9PEZI|nr:general substrate transporter [Elsinoe ampelina]